MINRPPGNSTISEIDLLKKHFTAVKELRDLFIFVLHAICHERKHIPTNRYGERVDKFTPMMNSMKAAGILKTWDEIDVAKREMDTRNWGSYDHSGTEKFRGGDLDERLIEAKAEIARINIKALIVKMTNEYLPPEYENEILGTDISAKMEEDTTADPVGASVNDQDSINPEQAHTETDNDSSQPKGDRTIWQPFGAIGPAISVPLTVDLIWPVRTKRLLDSFLGALLIVVLLTVVIALWSSYGSGTPMLEQAADQRASAIPGSSTEWMQSQSGRIESGLKQSKITSTGSPDSTRLAMDLESSRIQLLGFSRAYKDAIERATSDPAQTNALEKQLKKLRVEESSLDQVLDEIESLSQQHAEVVTNDRASAMQAKIVAEQADAQLTRMLEMPETLPATIKQRVDRAQQEFIKAEEHIRSDKFFLATQAFELAQKETSSIISQIAQLLRFDMCENTLEDCQFLLDFVDHKQETLAWDLSCDSAASLLQQDASESFYELQSYRDDFDRWVLDLKQAKMQGKEEFFEAGHRVLDAMGKVRINGRSFAETREHVSQQFRDIEASNASARLNAMHANTEAAEALRRCEEIGLDEASGSDDSINLQAIKLRSAIAKTKESYSKKQWCVSAQYAESAALQADALFKTVGAHRIGALLAVDRFDEAMDVWFEWPELYPSPSIDAELESQLRTNPDWWADRAIEFLREYDGWAYGVLITANACARIGMRDHSVELVELAAKRFAVLGNKDWNSQFGLVQCMLLLSRTVSPSAALELYDEYRARISKAEMQAVVSGIAGAGGQVKYDKSLFDSSWYQPHWYSTSNNADKHRAFRHFGLGDYSAAFSDIEGVLNSQSGRQAALLLVSQLRRQWPNTDPAAAVFAKRTLDKVAAIDYQLAESHLITTLPRLGFYQAAEIALLGMQEDENKNGYARSLVFAAIKGGEEEMALRILNRFDVGDDDDTDKFIRLNRLASGKMTILEFLDQRRSDNSFALPVLDLFAIHPDWALLATSHKVDRAATQTARNTTPKMFSSEIANARNIFHAQLNALGGWNAIDIAGTDGAELRSTIQLAESAIDTGDDQVAIRSFEKGAKICLRLAPLISRAHNGLVCRVRTYSDRELSLLCDVDAKGFSPYRSKNVRGSGQLTIPPRFAYALLTGRDVIITPASHAGEPRVQVPLRIAGLSSPHDDLPTMYLTERGARSSNIGGVRILSDGLWSASTKGHPQIDDETKDSTDR